MNTHEVQGGAARAASRLHKGLRGIGADSLMLVQSKHSDDPTVVGPGSKIGKGLALLRPELDSLPLRTYRNRKGSIFSVQWIPDSTRAVVENLKPDIINLHWVCDGFLKIETIAKWKRPVVWTLHDSWAFTGGCHIPFDCLRYTDSCGCCPQLQSKRSGDISHRIWLRKKKTYRRLQPVLVTPSRWLSDCVKKSSLMREARIEVIPHGLALTRFKPVNKLQARNLLNLPSNKHLILFGAMRATEDPNKGFQYLVPALQKLRESGWQDKAELVIFGSSFRETKNRPPIKTHFLGTLQDDLSLSMVYTAADVFVAPSIQESFGNTVLEAIACGTPCVAFPVGGIPDMIEHKKNGYLASPFDVEDLAHGITWVIEDTERNRMLGLRAQEKGKQEFSIDLQARRYKALYEDILSR